MANKPSDPKKPKNTNLKSSKERLNQVTNNLDPDKKFKEMEKERTNAVASLYKEQNNSLRKIQNSLSNNTFDEDEEKTITNLKQASSVLMSVSGKLNSLSKNITSLKGSVSSLRSTEDTTVTLLGSIKVSLMQISGVLSAFRADYILANNGHTPRGEGYYNKNLILRDLQALSAVKDSTLKNLMSQMRQAANYANMQSNAVRGRIGAKLAREDEGGAGLIAKLLGKLSPDVQEVFEESGFGNILGMLGIDDTNIASMTKSVLNLKGGKSAINRYYNPIDKLVNKLANDDKSPLKNLLGQLIQEKTGFGQNPDVKQREKDPSLVLSALAPLADDIKDLVKHSYAAVSSRPKLIPLYAKPVWVVNSKYQENGFDKKLTKERNKALSSSTYNGDFSEFGTTGEDFIRERALNAVRGNLTNLVDENGETLAHFDKENGEYSGKIFENLITVMGKQNDSYNDRFEAIAKQYEDYKRQSEAEKNQIVSTFQDVTGRWQQRIQQDPLASFGNVDTSFLDAVYGAVSTMGIGLIDPEMRGNITKPFKQEGRSAIAASVRNPINKFKTFASENKEVNKNQEFMSKILESIYKLGNDNGIDIEDPTVDDFIIKLVRQITDSLDFSSYDNFIESVNNNITAYQAAISGSYFAGLESEILSNIDLIGKKIFKRTDNTTATPSGQHASGRKPKNKKSKKKSKNIRSVPKTQTEMIDPDDEVVPEVHARDNESGEDSIQIAHDQSALIFEIAANAGITAKLLANINEDIILASNEQAVTGKHKNSFNPFKSIMDVFSKSEVADEKIGSQVARTIKSAEKKTDLSNEVKVKPAEEKEENKNEQQEEQQYKPKSLLGLAGAAIGKKIESKFGLDTKEKKEAAKAKLKENFEKTGLGRFLKSGKKLVDKKKEDTQEKLQAMDKKLGAKFDEVKEKAANKGKELGGQLKSKLKEKLDVRKEKAKNNPNSIGGKLLKAGDKAADKVASLGKSAGKKLDALAGRADAKLGKLADKMDAAASKSSGNSPEEKAEQERQKQLDEATKENIKKEKEAQEKASKEKVEGEKKRQDEKQDAQSKINKEEKQAQEKISKAEEKATQAEIKEEQASAKAINKIKEQGAMQEEAQEKAATLTNIATEKAGTATAIATEQAGATASAGLEVTGGGIEATGSAFSGSPLGIPIAIAAGVAGVAVIGKLVSSVMKKIKSGKKVDDSEFSKASKGLSKSANKDADKKNKEEKKRKEKEKKQKEKEEKKNGKKSIAGKAVGALLGATPLGLAAKLLKKKKAVYIDQDGSVKYKEDSSPVKVKDKDGNDTEEVLNVNNKDHKKKFVKMVTNGEVKIVKNPNKSNKENKNGDEAKKVDEKINNESGQTASKTEEKSGLAGKIGGVVTKAKDMAVGGATGLMSKAKESPFGKMLKTALVMAAPAMFMGKKLQKSLGETLKSGFGKMLQNNPLKASNMLFKLGGGGAALSVAKSLAKKAVGAIGLAGKLMNKLSGKSEAEKTNNNLTLDLAKSLESGTISENASLGAAQTRGKMAKLVAQSRLNEKLGLSAKTDIDSGVGITTSEIVQKEREAQSTKIAVYGQGAVGVATAANSGGGGQLTDLTEINGIKCRLWIPNQSAGMPLILAMPGYQAGEGDAKTNCGVYQGCAESAPAALVLFYQREADHQHDENGIKGAIDELVAKYSLGSGRYYYGFSQGGNDFNSSMAKMCDWQGVCICDGFGGGYNPSIKKMALICGGVDSGGYNSMKSAYQNKSGVELVLKRFNAGHATINFWSGLASMDSYKKCSYYKDLGEDPFNALVWLCGGTVGHSAGGPASTVPIQAGRNVVEWLIEDLGDGTYVSSPYGMRSMGMHYGVDLANKLHAIEGTPIHTPAGGTVVASLLEKDSGGCGNYVKIKGNDGYFYHFMHMKEPPEVQKGDIVAPGARLGVVGNTGHSFGAHLHFGVGTNEDTLANQNPANFSMTGKGKRGGTSTGGHPADPIGDKENERNARMFGQNPLGGKNLNPDDSETGRGKAIPSDHIYQRKYSAYNYNSNDDSEIQTLGDSGCGPASAATVKGIYNAKAKYGRAKENENNTTNTDATATDSNATANISKGGNALGKTAEYDDDAGNHFSVKIDQEHIDIFNQLCHGGLTEAVACGILGNLHQETGGTGERLRYWAEHWTYTHNHNGTAGGIMQWTTTPASAENKHVTWAKQNGFADNPWSWESSLAHMEYELKHGGMWSRALNASPSLESKGYKACSNTDEFIKLTDPAAAAVNFERAFEGSGDWNGRNSEGIKYKDSQIYDRLRVGPAICYYQCLVGTYNGAVVTSNGTASGVSGAYVDLITDNFVDGIVLEKYVTDDSGLFTSSRLSKLASKSKSPDDEESASTAKGKYGRGKRHIGKLKKPKSDTGRGKYFGRGKDDEIDTSSTSSSVTLSHNSSYSSQQAAILAAADVFLALQKENPSGSYDADHGYRYTIHTSDGQDIKVRPDCTGVMTAVIQRLGYLPIDNEPAVNINCHSPRSWFEQHATDYILNKDKSQTTDWQVLPYSDETLQPGDIVVMTGHAEMFMWWGGGQVGSNPCGLNAGSTNAINNSYALAKYIMETTNGDPNADYSKAPNQHGLAMLGYHPRSTVHTILRYVGNGITVGSGVTSTNGIATGVNTNMYIKLLTDEAKEKGVDSSVLDKYVSNTGGLYSSLSKMDTDKYLKKEETPKKSFDEKLKDMGGSIKNRAINKLLGISSYSPEKVSASNIGTDISSASVGLNGNNNYTIGSKTPSNGMILSTENPKQKINNAYKTKNQNENATVNTSGNNDIDPSIKQTLNNLSKNIKELNNTVEAAGETKVFSQKDRIYIQNAGQTVIVCNQYDNKINVNVEDILSHFSRLNKTQSRALIVLREINDLIKLNENTPDFNLNSDDLHLLLKGI